jgi:hypothetical protein
VEVQGEESEDLGLLLAGGDRAERRHGCPLGCTSRFWRVYDVRRHLKGEHELDVDDLEARRLLAGVVTGEAVEAVANPGETLVKIEESS